MSVSSLADPAGTTALVAAVTWLQGTMLGTVATAIAVIAMASIGLGMLSGRVDLRRGITVITGCFVLFGATGIVAGIRATMGDPDSVSYAPPPLSAPPAAPAAPQRPSTYDPYAGASVPSG